MSNTERVSRTGNQSLDGIIDGFRWGNTSLTYSFPTESGVYGANYGSGETTNGFSSFTVSQQAAVRRILSQYSAVANVSFQEVGSSQAADLRFAQSNAVSTAWTYDLGLKNQGDMWFNGSGLFSNTTSGSYAYMTIMHEIGHSLGLKHGHERDSFGALPSDYDSLEYSVMTYRSYLGDDPSDGYSLERGGYPQTPMMQDVAALQQLYGANFSTQSGNTVYSWDPATGEMFINGKGQGAPTDNRVFATVWDGGGTDTYDLSAYQNGVSIDLRPGQWSITSSNQIAALSTDHAHMAAGNIANALLYDGDTRSLIENAIGGAGDNLIIGNQADNRLSAGAGQDVIYGDLGRDLIYGNQGADTIFGGDDDDRAFGGKDDDVIYGNQGADQIYGNLGNDCLTGGSGDDSLFGGQGQDTLIGGVGNDQLVGGIGADLYVFGAGTGADIILGFNAGEGDRLALSGQSYTVLDDGRGGTLLNLSGGGSIDLVGVRVSEFSASAIA